MTTNILLDETGREPIRSEDEYFILKRNDISYRILLESKTQYTGEGYLILTSNRLVIFPTKQNCHFKAIEIPLRQIYQEEFKQPLFGKNYLTGKCNPVFASPLGAFTFTIWLKGNRMGTRYGRDSGTVPSGQMPDRSPAQQWEYHPLCARDLRHRSSTRGSDSG